MRLFSLLAILAGITVISSCSMPIKKNDANLWLEDIQGKKPLAWVKKRNKLTTDVFEKDVRFQSIYQKLLADYNQKDKIPYSSIHQNTVYNFWQDEDNIRGLIRKTSLESYQSSTPQWQPILSIDKLAKEEKKNWVYSGLSCLYPNKEHCMVRLSIGGSDAVVAREFNMITKQFVSDGFYSPHSKQNITWLDKDHLLISTNFGDDSLNEAGYSRQVRLWKRGQPLQEAKILFNAPKKTNFTSSFSSNRPDGNYVGIIESPNFFTEIIYLLEKPLTEAKLHKLSLPLDISFQGFFADQLILQIKKDWHLTNQTIASGSLISINIEDVKSGNIKNNIHVIVTPKDRYALEEVMIGKNHLFINLLHEVKGQLLKATFHQKKWGVKAIPLQKNASLNLVSTDDWSDNSFINSSSFLQPSTLYILHNNETPKSIKQLPTTLDTKDLVSEQHFAISKDGTSIPYFLIKHKNTPSDGSTPTLLYGYGGFEVSMTPYYLKGTRKLWLEHGGAFAIANIRGGGEFGPAWHQAAIKENRQNAYDDFIAVAENLIQSGLTSPRRLGIQGGSNGGLLMGVMLTQRPELFNAVICSVPLLDMLRYNKLLAGASWMGEYGNPDIAEQRKYLLKYSPYQNLNANKKYPEIFFTTSTKDDRVHPGHARKMAKKMIDMGKSIYYYENVEGGHNTASNLKQSAYMNSLELVYILRKLKD